ncbi:MAG: hypothetical protein DHS20C10_11420 [marine bacterium B5-7]|nr:MAG: hypothetical protein DHS20C10_11420 [marine bacterium B5-7]
MKSLIKRLFVCAGILLSLSSHASTLSKQINQAIRDFDPNLNIGIDIVDLRRNEVLYHRNDQRLYHPASTLKLFTALASLLALGPDYRFQTQIRAAGDDIYIRFSGDPTLTNVDLDTLAMQLRMKNVKHIKGNVYLDTTAMAGKSYGPGWMWDELNLCYAAPVEAVSVNHNCFRTVASTTWFSGKPVQLQDYPLKSYLPIRNQAITASSDSNCDLDLRAAPDNHYSLTGCLHKRTRSLALDVAINNPSLFAKQLLQHAFQQAGVSVHGKWLEKGTPKKSHLITAHRSQALRDIVIIMLKTSDNHIADTLFKTLATHQSHRAGTWSEGEKAIRTILQKQAKLDLTKATIVDGSGLSRYNLVTPDELMQILTYAYHNFHLEPEFLAGLPIAGVDGTLRKRLLKTALSDQLRAKTGSMQGISTLAGYLEGKDKHRYAFVVMSNNFSVKCHDLHKLEKKIVKALVG